MDDVRREADQPLLEEEETIDDSGAYGWAPLVDEECGEKPPPEEFSNPPGIGRGDCDAAQGEGGDCDLELTAEVDDFVLEETKPGFGIAGFEGEEDGGG